MAEARRQRPKFDPAVSAYKEILRRVLESRPSGMRQKLARAMGKNRSFVSQISNPSYQVPVPVQHLDRIFDICHFAPAEKKAFLDAYAKAHPRRFAVYEEASPGRSITIDLPDLGDAQKNQRLERLVRDMVERLSEILVEESEE